MRATKDAQQLRHDLYDWGFSLIEQGMDGSQVVRMRDRVEEQAAG